VATLQFLEVNDAAVQRYGYARDEFLAMTIKEIRPPEDVEPLLTELSKPRSPWQAYSGWRHRLKSGQIIDVELTAHTITFAGASAALIVAGHHGAQTRRGGGPRARAVVSVGCGRGLVAGPGRLARQDPARTIQDWAHREGPAAAHDQ
jgi:PAS domain S-box-containing protein